MDLRRPSTYYDEAYWRGEKGAQGVGEDHGLYYGISVALTRWVDNCGEEWVNERGAVVWLDCGCGPGFVVRHLQNQGWRAYGVDYAPVALQWGLSRESDQQLDGRHEGMVCGELTDLPFGDNQVDIVMSWQVLEHLDEVTVDKGLLEMRRVGRWRWVHSIALAGTGGAEDDPAHSLVRSRSWWMAKHVALGYKRDRIAEEQIAGCFGNDSTCEQLLVFS